MKGAFGEQWEKGNVHQLLVDGPVRDSLKMLDPKILRSKFLLSPDPTPAAAAANPTVPPAQDDDDVVTYTCNIGLPNGNLCNNGRPFYTWKAYSAHLQKQHQICEAEHRNRFVLTSMCPVCDQIFKTRLVAVNHFQRSLL